MRVEYIRDGLLEEWHEGCFVSLSQPNSNPQPFYLRSCAKPLQASLLLDYGVKLEDDELALCSGSHAGEECHIEVAKRLLKKFDLDENLLQCGVHAPLARSMQDKMLLRGEKAKAIHNNCSGKHIGFLILGKINNWDLSNYFEPNHPLQMKVREKINSMCEVKEDYPMTTDGCGVPILSMPLYNLILGFKNLVLNYSTLTDAIMNNPYIYGGENRLDTEIIQNSTGLIAKVGAGGLCVVLNTKTLEGFAVKIDDCSMDARRVAVFEILKKLNWANIEYDNKIRTIQGKIVGEVVVKDNDWR